ncbi:MAG: hypothetical protein VB110_10715 [Bacteroidales bacterium]|nr:hypothetical protein [Bacteroidales bacterium]
MKIIAESSSFKTEWVIIEGCHVIESTFTDGINPFFQTRKEISRCIRLQLPKKFFSKLEEIHFYGAGCTTNEKKDIVNASLVTQFRAPAIVNSDLLGAARAFFGEKTGIACILDVGSNSCFYDGEQIVKNVRSLGYILGDEGSGAVLGKMFLSDCLKNLAPVDISQEFYDKYRITSDDVLEMVYNRSFPSTFLSSISFLLAGHLDNEYVYNLIYKNIRRFFVRNLMQYDYQNYPISFNGSIASTYSSILSDVAKEFDVEIEEIVESSIKGLIKYHTMNIAHLNDL